jgi:geranylgeranyl pyrophosphate synthase
MTTQTTGNLNELRTSGYLAPIQEDLAHVEALLNSEIRSDVRAAYTISGHTLSAGGKRLRPASVLLSARAVLGSFPTRTIYASAASVELIHMASLIHDDVVDAADERRGRPTANAAFGNQISVLVGDYLLAKSIFLAATEGNIDLIRVFSKVTVGLSEGEVLQLTAQGDPDTTEETYYDIIRRKTAGFISGCCEVGAMLAGADEDVLSAMIDYGYSIGLAFQIADDLLDFLGDPRVTGKPRGSDLREGKMTLPLIAACRSLRQADPLLAHIGALIRDPDRLSDEDIAYVCTFVDNHGGFSYAKQAAYRFVDDARVRVSRVLPESLFRDSLISLAEYSLGRER